ncbi:hypothetical protein HPP92_009802 [Vanilla planifolia]|uniref:Uncharacterized protein n=1 Tax=Vanilla planifolia TaxID=51239 RepID=A0A835V5T3_VANPL|nr:hypothetical protein HPP92_009802 [Vanilla planifolia]
MATTATAAAVKTKAASHGDLVVLYVPLGLVLLGLTMGAYTAQRQLASSPSVRINKKRRGTVPEVDEPEHVAGEAERFVNRSFFRSVAHVQDFDATRSGISDPTRPENVFRQ